MQAIGWEESNGLGGDCQWCGAASVLYWFGCFGFGHICETWALFGITVVLLRFAGCWTLVFDVNYGNVGLTLSSIGCFYWVRSGVIYNCHLTNNTLNALYCLLTGYISMYF